MERGRLKDAQPILNGPEFPNSVRWAEDGTLAFAAGNSVTLLHPGALGGPRAFVGLDARGSDDALMAPGDPADPSLCLDHELAYMRSLAMDSTYPNFSLPQAAQAVAWSPAGAAPAGGCLLAAVTNDHRVRVFGPAAALRSEWDVTDELSGRLLAHLQATGWAEVDAAGAGAEAGEGAAGGEAGVVAGKGDGGALRLRGGAGGRGAKRPRSPADADADADSEATAGEEEEEEEEADAAGPSKAAAVASNDDAKRPGGRRKAAAPQAAPTGGAALPPAGLPGVDAADDDRALRRTAPAAAARRFLALRAAYQPADALPSYPTQSTHLKGPDVELLARVIGELQAAHGADLAGRLGWDAKRVNKEVRIALRATWDRVRNREKAEEATTESESGSGSDSGGEAAGGAGGVAAAVHSRRARQQRQQARGAAQGGSPGAAAAGEGDGAGTSAAHAAAGAAAAPAPAAARGAKKVKKEKEEVPPPFEPPPEFTWRDLPPVDNTNRSTLRRGLTRGAMRRFFRLRQQNPRVAARTYPSKGSHLLGLDAWLTERVTAEYVAAHGPALEALSYDAKKFHAQWMQALRACWDRTGLALRADLTLEDDDGVEHPPGDAPPLPIDDREGPLVAPGGKARAARARVAAAKAEDGGAAKTKAKAKPRLSSAAAAAAAALPRARPGAQPGLPSEVYQRRLAAVCAVSVAWSPAARDARGGRFCMLAVGTKEGRVWLWRCALPRAFSLPGAAPGGGYDPASRARFELVGSLPGGPAWAAALAWAAGEGTEVLTLAVGASDGSVALWGAAASTLAALPPLPASSDDSSSDDDGDGGGRAQQAVAAAAQQGRRAAAMARWAAPLPADGRAVTSLETILVRPSTPEGLCRLMLAAGKSVGGVAVWASADFDPGAAPPGAALAAAAAGGAACYAPSAPFGTNTVTGVAFLLGGQELVACSREGTLLAWILQQQGGGGGGAPPLVQITPAPPPLPAGSGSAVARRSKKEAGNGAFGVATSPGGLYLAVARLALPPATDYVKQLQIHQRVALGVLQLQRAAGPGLGPQLDAAAWVAGVAAESWVRGAAPPSALWDAATLLAAAAGWPPAEAAGGGAPPPEPRALQAATTVAQLEEEFWAAAAAAQAAGPAAGFMPSVSATAWRGLVAAAAMRRALHAAAGAGPAARPGAAQSGGGGGDGPPQDDGATGPGDDAEGPGSNAWAQALERNELALLQRRMHQILAPLADDDAAQAVADDPAAALTAALAADWVRASADLLLPALRPELEALARRAHEVLPGAEPSGSGEEGGGGADGGHSGPPAREAVPSLGGARVALRGRGVAAAVGTEAVVGGARVPVPRCPATLRVCGGPRGWGCRLCGRRYAAAAAAAEGGGSPACLLCGGLLGPTAPPFMLAPPCQ